MASAATRRENKEPCSVKPLKNRLDSDRPSHGMGTKAYTIHLCKQGKEFQKILDFAALFRRIVGAVIVGKWKILGVTTSGPSEARIRASLGGKSLFHSLDCGPS